MESPVGKTKSAMDQEDEFTASLTNIAYSPAKPQSGRKSRFWFTISTVAEDVAETKATMVPVAKEHIDAEVVARLAEYKVEVQPLLKANIEAIREFFLIHIAPLVLASSAGTIQSKEVVQRLLDSPVDSALFNRFDNMVNRAATLKMALFVEQYFGLTNQAEALLGPTATQQNSEMRQLMDMLKQMATKQDLYSGLKAVQETRDEKKQRGTEIQG